MDEEIETLLIGVRANTRSFARDVADMRGQLEGPLADGAARAGQSIEGALLKAVRTGKLGFDDLKRAALSVMSEIAASALRSGIGAIGGGGGSSGLLAAATTAVAALLGAPGRATGGPVSPARPYLVGERGPEWFVPTASGRINPDPGGNGARDIRLSITVNAPAGAEPRALAQSSRQVARAVRAALMKAD